MQLDKRIKDTGSILTCFSIKAAKEYLGQQGYFTNTIDDYQNLEQFTDFRTLAEVSDDETPFSTGQLCYQFFLPAEFVRPAEAPAEKKWRPFTVGEFIKKFPLMTPVIIRDKPEDNRLVAVKYVTGYSKTHPQVYLGVVYGLEELFKYYEYQDKHGNWLPFGVEE